MRPGRHGFPRPGRLAPAAWAALLACSLAAPAAHGDEPALEVAVKATYLVKFLAFVQWPPSAWGTPSGPLALCIVGTPLAGLADQAAAGQTVASHPVAARHIATATRNSGCQVLYTAGVTQQSVEAALDAVHGEPVLTVTDLPPAAAHKGIINFVLRDNHVRFEIDERAAAEAGLRISSQLLALAVNSAAR